MNHHWDEFSKSIAQRVPRRESLRRLGFVVAGAVLSPLGLDSAWAGYRDPCKAFCRCRNKSQQNACLAACNACNKDTTRLCGTCGTYVCCREPGPGEHGACIDGHCQYACAEGAVYCDGVCTFLGNDPDNCGACGNVCGEPGPYEYGACINGGCEYACAEGAVYCNGFCTFLGWDSHNCGACGNTCPGSAPVCNQGVCVCPSGMAVCDGECVNILSDPDNCGACGAACPSSAPYCHGAVCSDRQCAPGLTLCNYGCVNLSSDPYNCGACGHQCAAAETCSGGTCQGICVGCE